MTGAPAVRAERPTYREQKTPMSTEKITVAVVGLRFGSYFAPIYQNHPAVENVVLCDQDPAVLDRIGDRFGITDRTTSFEEVLERDDITAVHLLTPIPIHGGGTIAALRAGKHVACAVPMAVDLKEMSEIVRLERELDLRYMMMETAVYTTEFLQVKALVHSGEFGELHFGRGAHHQDMAGWPGYWQGLPPFWYMTHAIAPLLALLDTHVSSVRAIGSGRLDPEREARYGNPFTTETGIFTLADSDVAVEVTRSLFGVTREGQESFAIYGSRRSFEWQQVEAEPPVHFIRGEGGGEVTVQRAVAPDVLASLPEPLRRFARETTFQTEDGVVTQGGEHYGSHPHLAHEFVSSILEGRPSSIDAVTAAQWTAAGVVAHESAMRGGLGLDVPAFGAPATAARSSVADDPVRSAR